MFKAFPGVAGTLSTLVSSGSAVLPLSAALADILVSGLTGADWTYLLLKSGDTVEVVKVNSVTGVTAAVTRAIDGTTAQAFPAGATAMFYMTPSAVIDLISANGVPVDVVITGEGEAEVEETSPGTFVINVETPEVIAVPNGGVEILGTWPNISIGLTNPSGCCDDDTGEASGAFSVLGYGLAQVVAVDPVTYSVTVEPPNFVGAGGLVVTGTWPDLTFTFSGSVGSVGSVGAGTGINITGTPSIAPIVNITATGVAAGSYGGLVVNAQGQLTAIPATFNAVSIINVTPDTGLAIARLADAVTLAGIDSGVTVKGVIALADPDAPLDPDDDTTAVTPALLSTVLEDLQFTEIEGGQTYNGNPDIDYVTVVPSATVLIDIPADGKVLVIISVTVKNDADVTDIPDYGLALFTTGGTRLQANPIIKQAQQVLHCLIEGPATYSLAIVVTDITGYTVKSNSMQAVVV